MSKNMMGLTGPKGFVYPFAYYISGTGSCRSQFPQPNCSSEAENRATHAVGTAVEDFMPGARENRPSLALSPEDLGPASRTALRNVTSLQQGEPVPGVDSQTLY